MSGHVIAYAGDLNFYHNILSFCAGVSNSIKKQNKAKQNKQGKSEGFESCDRPIVRKRPIWVKIDDVL